MNENIFFGKNLKYLRKKRGITQQEIADLIGRKSTSSVSDWEAGRTTPNAGNISKIASYFGLRIDAMMENDLEKGISNPTNIIEIKQTHNIPVIGTITCGEPILAQENISDTVPFPVELLPSGNLFFLKAQGNSMEPTIKEDALVLIRKQEEVENGEIAAVLVNRDTDATLKKVRKLGDTILLEAINEEYAPYLVNKENPARIIGKAVKVINNLQ